MRRYTLRFRKVNEDTFLAVKSGRKKVETRAATSRYRSMAAGDTVVFVCGRKKFSRTVKRAVHFKGIAAMLRRYPVRAVMPDVKSRNDMEKKYRSFPGYKEKLRKFGLVALEFT